MKQVGIILDLSIESGVSILINSQNIKKENKEWKVKQKFGMFKILICHGFIQHY